MKITIARVSASAAMLALMATGYLSVGQVGGAAEPEPGPQQASSYSEPATTPKEATDVVVEAGDPAPNDPAPMIAPDAGEPVAVTAARVAEPDPQVVATAAPDATYADWTLSGANPSWSGTTTLPGAVNFPPAHYATNSTTPTIPSGASSFLGPETPFGAVFGSSQSEPYLNLRTAAGLTPSTTTFTFDTATPPFGWGFALGDIDADAVTISGSDKSGNALTAAELGFMGVFNYCSVSPRPGSCTAGPFTDVPTWDSASATLTGNVNDTQGAAAWFMPVARIKTLTFDFSALSGNPIYQVWFAALLGEIRGDVMMGDAPSTTTPASGVSVSLGYPDGDPVVDQSGNPIRPATGADGAFDQTGLVAGRYAVTVLPPSGYSVSGDATVAAVASTPAGDPVHFTLLAPGAGPGPGSGPGSPGDVANPVPDLRAASAAGSSLPGTGGGGVVLTLAVLLLGGGACLRRLGARRAAHVSA